MAIEDTNWARAGSFSTDEAVLYETAIQPWELNVDFSQSGRFQCDIRFFSMEGVTVYRDHYAHGMRLRGMTPPNILTIGIPIAGITDDSAFWGKAIDPKAIYPTFHREIDSRTTSGHDQFVILIDTAFTHDPTLNEIVDFFSSASPPVFLQPANFRHLADVCHLILGFANEPRVLDDAYLVSVLRCSLLGAIQRAVLESSTSNGMMLGRRENRALAMMYEALLANEESPVTVRQLCSEIGVNERTLQRAVRAEFDCTVHHLLRRRRIHEARRQLLHSESGRLSVTEVSHSLGFHDGGRFARDYKKIFGEYPSQTLQRKPVESVQLFFP